MSRPIINYIVEAATKLFTGRQIGGVLFDGTQNINLPGVNIAGNQNTSGNAATATKLQTVREIAGVGFDGTANIDLPGVNIPGNQPTTGNAASATRLQTGRNINGTSFNGTANIVTAQWGTARNITIGDSTKSVNGGSNVGWTFEEIGLGDVSRINTTGLLTHFLRSDGTWAHVDINDTKYTAGAGLTLLGTQFSLPVTVSGTGTFVTSVEQVANGIQINLGTPPNQTYSEITEAEVNAGTSSTLRTITGRRLKLAVDAHGLKLGTTATTARPGNWTPAVADIPSLPASKVTSGEFDPDRIPELDASKIGTGVLDSARIPTLNQNTTGNAATATRLATARTISATGDAAWSVSFNGSANATAVLTLAASGVAAGTYTKVTVDAKGRVTAGASLVAADIPNLDAGKITSGVFAAARIPTLNQSTTGNAATATKLANSRSISITGDGSWSVDFDGTENVSAAFILANSGVIAGSHGSQTTVPVLSVDIKGRVTSLTSQAIPSATTSVAGLVQLTTSTNSTSNTLAATASAVRNVRLIADAAIPSALIGVANGVAPLDENKLIPAEFLPSYVDDVMEFPNYAALPTVGETGKLYLTIDNDNIYRWSGSTYIHINASVGSADQATRLATARTIAMTGDGTWSVSFNGASNVSAALVLAATGVGAGTYPKVTVDAKGRVTAGTALVAADIPVLDAAKVTTGVFAAARIPTLNQSTTGNAATATKLQTARTIGGVSFDGTANINLPGVNTAGNQNTSGSAARLTTARTLTVGRTGKTFNGSANVSWTLAEILPTGGTTANFLRGDGTWATVNTENTTYSAGNGLTLLGTEFSLPVDVSGTGTFVTGVEQTANGLQINLGTPPNTNTTYAEITEAEITTGTASTLRTITARRLKFAIDTHGLQVGTIAGTAAEGNDSRIVNAVPNSRTITAGTGLTGGGNLTANRSLAVSYGTAAGTAAQGNDSRINNGQTAFGWGNHADAGYPRTGTLNSTDDLNDVVIPGFYGHSSGSQPANTPLTSGAGHVWVTISSSSVWVKQVWLHRDNYRIFIRQLRSSNGWDAWKEIRYSDSLLTTDIPDLPATKITNGVFGVDRIPNLDAAKITTGVFAAARIPTLNQSTTGNAATATVLQTARTINGTSFNGSANITTANWGTARTLTIGSTGKSVNGAGNVAWTLAEILPTGGTTANFLRGDGTWATVSTQDTTYSEITEAEVTAGTSSTLRTITGRRLKLAVDTHGLKVGTTASTAKAGNWTPAAADIPNLDAGKITSGVFAAARIPTLNQNTTGSAATLTTARTIGLSGSLEGSVSFNGSANVIINAAVARPTITSDPTSTFRATIFDGTSQNGIRLIRGGASTGPFANYSPAIAWSTSDTHAFLTLNYNSKVARVGAGSGTGISWQGELAFTDSNITGNAASATILQTARTIGGVSFNGSANINLPGVNTAGNQNTSGNAATATALQTARTIGGVSFNGTANINLPGVNATGNQNTTGSAASLTTARTINGTSFNGTANITTANWGTARTLQIGRTGKSVNGSANVSWSIAEIVGAGGIPYNTEPLGAVDLNTVQDPGFYYQASGSNGTLANNYPVANAVGALRVTFAGVSGRIIQEYVTMGIDPKLYVRGSSNQTTWGDWKEVLTDGSTIAANTAATLATSRTINGTGFNGSGNITTANWGTARTLTVGRTGKSVNGSANIAWTLAEILPTGGTTANFLRGDGTWAAVTAPAPSNMVTTNSAQTISSTKTFSAAQIVSNTTNSTSATTGAFQVRGGIGVTSDIWAGGNITAYSDIRLKEDIKLIENPLKKIGLVRGVTYTRKDTGKVETGLIAQELQAVLPEAVHGEDTLGVDYGRVVGLLVEGIKELTQQVADLKAEIAELRNK